MGHDFRHAAMHVLSDWPVLHRIAQIRTDARRLDSRTVASLYTFATAQDWSEMSAEEQDYAKEALAFHGHSHP